MELTMHKIWTVTTLAIRVGRDAKSRTWGYYLTHPRTWGYYLTRNDAIAGMHKCIDTEAGYYTHVVIESFEPGIYVFCHEENQEWFVWKDGWKECIKPRAERHIVNYGMG